MSDRTHIQTTIILAVLLLIAVPASCCDTPVWLFALDNWEANAYEILVFHRGPMSSAGTRAVSLLQQNALAGPLHANVRVFTTDLDITTDQTVKRLWESQRDATLPWIVAIYPGSGGFSSADGVRFRGGRQPVVAWSGALNEANVRSLLDSPSRKTIARQLTDRVTAVWVFLESGNRSKDGAALKVLETELSRLERTLVVPDLLDSLTGEEIDAEIRFSIVRISREDRAEQALAQMLLNSERGLHDYDEPMVFPIFGRGIILFALVGKGINHAMIADAAEFITGPCPCEVKALNPGVDMLLAKNWDMELERLNIADTPPPTGLTEFTAKAEKAEDLLKLPEEKPKGKPVSEPKPSVSPEESQSSEETNPTQPPDESEETAEEPGSIESSDEPEHAHLSDEQDLPEAAAEEHTGGRLSRNVMTVLVMAVTGIVAATLSVGIYRRRRGGA